MTVETAIHEGFTVLFVLGLAGTVLATASAWHAARDAAAGVGCWATQVLAWYAVRVALLRAGAQAAITVTAATFIVGPLPLMTPISLLRISLICVVSLLLILETIGTWRQRRAVIRAWEQEHRRPQS